MMTIHLDNDENLHIANHIDETDLLSSPCCSLKVPRYTPTKFVKTTMRLRRRELDTQNSTTNFCSTRDSLMCCTKIYRMCTITKHSDCDYYSKSSKTALSSRRNRFNTFFILLLPLVSFSRTVSTLRCYETENVSEVSAKVLLKIKNNLKSRVKSKICLIHFLNVLEIRDILLKSYNNYISCENVYQVQSRAKKSKSIFKGVTLIREDPAWKFCAVVPVIAYGHHYINGSQFGLGPQNDLLALYGSAFSLHDDVYRILSVCIYEVWSQKFKTYDINLNTNFLTKQDHLQDI